LPFPAGFLISQKFNDQIWAQKVGAHRIRHIFLSKSKAIFLIFRILKYVIRPVRLEWKFDPDCLFTFFCDRSVMAGTAARAWLGFGRPVPRPGPEH
jgi:hypothetical protein